MSSGLVRLTLRPLAGDVPATVRLRSLLKRLRRTCGYACVQVEELADEPKGEPVDPATEARPPTEGRGKGGGMTADRAGASLAGARDAGRHVAHCAARRAGGLMLSAENVPSRQEAADYLTALRGLRGSLETVAQEWAGILADIREMEGVVGKLLDGGDPATLGKLARIIEPVIGGLEFAVPHLNLAMLMMGPTMGRPS